MIFLHFHPKSYLRNLNSYIAPLLISFTSQISVEVLNGEKRKMMDLMIKETKEEREIFPLNFMTDTHRSATYNSTSWVGQ